LRESGSGPRRKPRPTAPAAAYRGGPVAGLAPEAIWESQQAGPRVIPESVRVAHVVAQRVDRLVPAHIHHLEQRRVLRPEHRLVSVKAALFFRGGPVSHQLKADVRIRVRPAVAAVAPN
jgi:hypothetical protein